MSMALASKQEPGLAVVKPKTKIEKRTHTTVDTIMITPTELDRWRLPSGQRPLRENAKVIALSEQLKSDGGVIPGILTLGVLTNNRYIIDGQHRLHAFRLSGLPEAYADVRFLWADSIAEINDEFVNLNSRLVTMRPDDFLRGLETSLPLLQELRRRCPFVGYDGIRRGSANAPMASMSTTLRAWRMSQGDCPASSSQASAVELAKTLIEPECMNLIEFLLHAESAWGRDKEYHRLWGSLNMIMCMWLYRHLVLEQYSPKTPRLTGPLYKKCLMSLSADGNYIDWLLGRNISEHDRGPCYSKVKGIFAKRLEEELGRKVSLPAPAWS